MAPTNNMKKVFLTVLTVAVIAFTGSSSFSQQKVSPEKEALIKELLVVSGAAKGAKDAADMMSAIQKGESEKMIASMIDNDKTLSAAEKEQLKKTTIDSVGRITHRVDEFFEKEFDLTKAIDEISVPIYDKHFTDSEIRELITFYRSPVGQKVITAMPELMMEMMTGFMEKLGPKLRDFLNRVTEEEFTALKKSSEQKPPPQKPKTK